MEARDSLNRLIAALENHFDVARSNGVAQLEALEHAESRLQDAFFTYDDVLFTRYGVELPFEMLDDDDDDDDDLDDDLEDDDDLDGDDDEYDEESDDVED